MLAPTGTQCLCVLFWQIERDTNKTKHEMGTTEILLRFCRKAHQTHQKFVDKVKRLCGAIGSTSMYLEIG